MVQCFPYPVGYSSGYSTRHKFITQRDVKANPFYKFTFLLGFATVQGSNLVVVNAASDGFWDYHVPVLWPIARHDSVRETVAVYSASI
jgi:hypothetical protein